MISDALNHASIIDGIRLCKAQRLRYANDDLDELETRLKEAAGARVKLIATDGVFSMDGVIARLKDICDLAERHGALVMVDDSHAIGFIGAGGRGTHEHRDVMGRVDILTGTLGKALGGAAAATPRRAREIVGWLRQRSRPVPVLEQHAAGDRRHDAAGARPRRVRRRAARAAAREHRALPPAHDRRRVHASSPGEHPIVPVMLGDAALAARFAERLLDRGVYVIGFSYPGRADGQGAHPHADVRGPRPHAARPRDRRRSTTVGRELGVIDADRGTAT